MYQYTKQILSTLFFFYFLQSNAQTPLPDTDIFLVDLKTKSQKISFGTPQNITHRTGYDNQPSFSADGSSVLFSCIKEDSQADIYQYDIPTKQIKPLCQTPESEFSPFVMTDNKSISVVRIEKDSVQRIWVFPQNGCEAKVIFQDIDSVGYYCWLGQDTAAMFIVTEPSSLILARQHTAPKKISENIGRCIRKIPGQNAFSFIEKIEPSLWVIKAYSLTTGKFRFLAQTPFHSEDYEWLKDGTILMGQEGKLLKFNPDKDKEWSVAADFSTDFSNITRIAVNPAGNKIALAGTLIFHP
jgi:hypothetical protein